MTKDVKMEEKKPEVEDSKEEKQPEAPAMPPLEAAARRLERLLGGGVADKDLLLHTYANPAKVVRRWFGTASGAAGKATLAEIASAAEALLDPKGPSSIGRQMLQGFNENPKDVSVAENNPNEGYLTNASAREVESWLISLSVRILCKEERFREAFDLVGEGIRILLDHLDAASTSLTSLSGVSTSSLFPPLARLYRYRALVAESLGDADVTASIRLDMVKAHNMACLRRDVECQATLLNSMLRDLLLHSQGE